ncbi:MAG: hypothetical protein KVP17_002670 [Porospora cf. gigantea B]|uniref:uncharacterized protein n=2 Tax=Porospora cf. gigantea B TaxID=2853592 RepID=UPI003571C89B|nr:MAG: hypothetical protein KVP17_002670 [Porospora cf. gigantea B]
MSFDVQPWKHRHDLRGQKWSLWLVPAGDDWDTVVKTVANEFNLTPFNPHLTITGGLREYSLSDVETLAAQIAKKVPVGEYEIRLGKLMTGDDYFKFVYVATEDPLLTSINNICRELVINNSVYDEAPFVPHMSLAYSPNSGLADAVATRCRDLVHGLRARVGSVVVAECDMDKGVRHWRVVSCWPFSG